MAIDPTNPNTLYAGTNKGVFKSTDGAVTWSLIKSDQAHSYIYKLAIDPLTLTIFTAGYQGVIAIQQVK